MERNRTPQVPLSSEQRSRSHGGSMLKVSENGRYFVRDGSPFFWMGDTVWSLVNRYTPQEAEEYLEHRRRQGFNVVHVMLLFDGGPGLTTPAADAQNQLPFIGRLITYHPAGGASSSFFHHQPWLAANFTQ